MTMIASNIGEMIKVIPVKDIPKVKVQGPPKDKE